MRMSTFEGKRKRLEDWLDETLLEDLDEDDQIDIEEEFEDRLVALEGRVRP